MSSVSLTALQSFQLLGLICSSSIIALVPVHHQAFSSVPMFSRCSADVLEISMVEHL